MRRRLYLIFMILPCVIFAQQQEIDSLKILLKVRDGVGKIDIMNKIAFDYNTIAPDSGIKYANFALHLAKDLGYQKGIATALQNTGVNCLAKGELKKAYEYNKQALEIFEKLQDQIGICESLINIGLVYNSFGENDKAIDYICRMLEIAEANRDTLRLVKGYINQSRILGEIGDNNKALEYIKLAEKLSEENGDLINLSISYINLGVTYFNLDSIDMAEQYFLNAERLCKKIGNLSGLVTSYLNLGELKQQKGQEKEALEYYQKALNGSEKIGDKSLTVLSSCNIGQIYLDANKFPLALKYFNKALHIAENGGTKSDLMYAYWGLYIYNEKKGYYKTALDYFKKYDLVAGDVYSKNSQKRILAIQAAYEVRKKNKEMEILKKEKAIQDMKIEKQHILLWLLIVAFVIIISVSTIILRLYKYQKTANIELSFANEKIKENENKLKRINKEQKQLLKKLEEANLTKDKFFSIVAHDIKSPLQVQLSGSRLLSDRIDTLDKEKIKEIASELKKNTMHLFDLLENLLNWSRLQQGRIEHKPERIQLLDMVNSVVSLMSGCASQKGIEIKTKIDNKIFINADPNMMKSVLQNLISNGIKFSNRGGEITISAKKNKKSVEICVQDRGTGIPEDMLKEIFRLDKQASMLGTEGEKGTGLGLVLCKDFIEKNGGKIYIDSKEGEGTKVTIVLSEEG